VAISLEIFQSSQKGVFMSRKLFPGKRVWIVGASSGIGAALALEFAREGARVALSSRRQDWLEKIAAQIKAIPGEALVETADVTKPETLQKAADRTAQTWGGIDIAVANAGFGVNGMFAELTTEDFRRQFETNFFGVVHTIYAALPYLKASRGRLVLMGSITGRVGIPTCSAYGASKFAINGLAECLCYEFAEDGVGVTWINPGIVESDFARVDNDGVFHEGRNDPRPAFLMMRADKAARQMLRGVYRGKTEVVITGHGKLMVWLSRHFPNFWRWAFGLYCKGKLDQFKIQRRSEG
jgi:short-subunit dehydrogenase